MKLWGWAVAAAMTVWGAGAAQAMTPAQVVGACKADSAFGQAFGGGPAPGAKFMMNSVNVDLQGYAPFESAELVYTPNSRRLHTVMASAQYGSEAEASAAFKALVAAARSDGRFAGGEGDDEQIEFKSEGPDGLDLIVFQLGSEVDVGCAQLAGQQLAMDEAMGKVAVTDKPQPPTLALPAPPPEGTCATAASRDAFLAEFENRMQDAMAFGSEASRYSTMLAQWKAGQLKARKVWTDEEDARFSMAMLDDPVFAGLFQASMDDFGAFMENLSAYSEAMDRKDPTAACAAAVKSLASARRILVDSQKQWDFVGARYDALAKSKGVVLD